MGMIRVMIVEDHVMVAQGMTEVLGAEDDIEVVGHVRTVAEARVAAIRHRPDVVLMDYRLPDGDGADAAAHIRRDLPGTSVVMVTASAHDSVLAAAVEAGCSGYVTKDMAAEDVVTAVRAAHAGQATIPPSLLARLLPRLQTTRRGPAALSPRELEVLRLVASGWSTRDIAEQLFVSVSTVRNHIQSTLRKLEAHSKLEAVATAVREGIIHPPGT
ncbi:MAG: response regulator transcription factor [Actinomycetota bacterium]|nr:response regulator transcription factor [Actinomycetota bacterium]